MIFTVSNLAAMGLRVKMSDVGVALQNKKSPALITVWRQVLVAAGTTGMPIVKPVTRAVVVGSAVAWTGVSEKTRKSRSGTD